MSVLQRIEKPRMMEVYVNGPRDANRLYIFTGIAVFNWHGTDDDNWAGESLHISMLGIPEAPRIFEDQVVEHVETASLASIHSRETRKKDAVGFSVNSVEAFFTRDPRHELDFADFGMDVQLALRGNDVRFYRVSFQLNVLARIDGSSFFLINTPVNTPFVYNVRDYDALGNDSAIDTSAIEAAIRACKQSGGGIILYPAGIYRINRPINDTSIVGSNDCPIFHLGQGESTIIKASPQRNALDNLPAFTMFHVGHGTGPRVFANMVIDGNKVAGVGIHFQSGGIPIRSNRVHNVRFENHRSIGVQGTGQLTGDSPDPSRYPIDLFQKESHEIVIDSCSFASIGERAVYFYYLTSGGVWDCDVDNTHGEIGGETAAITFNGCTNFTIARNRVTNWTIGINVCSSANYSIIDNLVRDTKSHGIVASGGCGLQPPSYHMSRRFVCAGNRIYNSGGHGITVDPQWYVLDENNNKVFNDSPVEQWGILTHNLVHRSGTEFPDESHGIQVNWSKHMLIDGNEVIESSLNGISLNESSHCTVVRNKISGWGNYGIGIHADASILGRGCHYLGDDNVISDEPYLQTDICADENIRCPGEISGKPCAKVYQVMGDFYVVEDETEERARVYICQKLSDDSYDWVQIV